MVNFVATTHLHGQKRCRRGDACRGISNNIKHSCGCFFYCLSKGTGALPQALKNGLFYWDRSPKSEEHGRFLL
nr:MAG TPA: hypothetical protein [Caudoviricetes sp.]